MKDDIWKKRQFLLSSFTRSNITIKTSVYRFVDELLRNKTEYPHDLNDLDKFILESYQRYLNG
jgi:hypothetical protein